MIGTFNGIPGIIEDMTLFFRRITAGIPSHIIAVFITVTAISFTAIIAVTDIVVIMDTGIVADTTGDMAAGTTEDLPLRKDRDDVAELSRIVMERISWPENTESQAVSRLMAASPRAIQTLDIL